MDSQQLSKILSALKQPPWREIFLGCLLIAAIVIVAKKAAPPEQPSLPGAPSEISSSSFSYTFNVPGILDEASDIGNTTSPFWFVDSGGKLIIENGIGRTIFGSLPSDDPWRLRYAADNPADTDAGYHPQNIFRLVSVSTWTNYTQQAYFKIAANNLSASKNRNESNGLLLFNRYQDANNLYYAGIRVDGTAVIKKKTGGKYFTMTQGPIFPGNYDPIRSPNLIPQDTWIGIKTEVTQGLGPLTITLYLDIGKTGNWIIAAQAQDDGKQYGGPIIAGPAHLGIRTDFMDVAFSDYVVTKE